MPRISQLDRSQVADETGAIYDHFMKVRGNVPNMFRTVAHRPEILKTMIAHFRAVMETGTVSAKLKELVITRTSQINRCEY
ncbi:MAG TPA: carboxymuconolactone decarboxylase family protein [Candidatus Solibacter sp.]|jgi:alkylhydroperoxidase family enzyme|nr:carboxymuconolactone decarboxylase family protein [Candidatus Solibacter sp.]